MERIDDWQNMPDDDNVVKLEAGDMVVRHHQVTETMDYLEHLIHRANLYGEHQKAKNEFETILEMLKLLHTCADFPE